MWLLVIAILQHADALRLDLNDTSKSQTDSERPGSCASICYGDTGFRTKRLGSRLFVLLQGFQFMQELNAGYMMFNDIQIGQLAAVMDIKEHIVSLHVQSNRSCTQSATDSQLIGVPNFFDFDLEESPIANDTFGNSLDFDLNRTKHLGIEVNRSNSLDIELNRSKRLDSDLNGSNSVDIEHSNFSTSNTTELAFAGGEKLTCQGRTPGVMAKFHTENRKFLFESRPPMIEFAKRFRKPCTNQTKELSDKTLVMHMRAGDVFQEKWLTSHAQPPCAFYQHVLETGLDGNAFENGIIVVGENKKHPCIKFLAKKFGAEKIRVQSGSLEEDACHLMAAKHVAVSVSAFAGGLLHLNWDVRKAYIPDIPAAYWWATYMISGTEMPYEQNIYTFPGYDFKKGMRDAEYMQSFKGNLTNKKIRASKSASITQTPVLEPAKKEAP